jgi:tetratricopeptide (TPR) repeat protein
MLIVLDNARDAAQVRPLLPGSPGCLVLVTSRADLTGLSAIEGAHLLTLEVLADAEACELIEGRLGATRVAAEPQALTELAESCAGLPLALAITAARAAARPGHLLAALAAEMHDADRLDALQDGDTASSVRAVFSWSYRQLSSDAARLFRLLGLHPGPDITTRAAASLAGIPAGQALGLLRELTRAHLLTEPVSGRYALHDLLRAYAVEQDEDEHEDARRAAVGRMLDHYLHTAHTAALLLNPAREITVAPPRPAATPEHLTDQPQALAWLDAEHQVLLAATTLADNSGLDVHAWQIPWALAEFLDRRGRFRDLATVQGTALAAATRLSDTAAQAECLRLLAYTSARLGDHDQALARYAAGLQLFQQLGDRLGQARVQQLLGLLAESQGRYADASSHAEQALCLYRAAGNRAGEAIMLNNLGWTRMLLGDHQQARVICQEALSVCAEIGLRLIEGHSWDSLGQAEHHLGHFAEAAACYNRALGIFREFGDRYFEPAILTHLGDTRHACGDLHQARETWQRALEILDEIGHPDAEQVRGKLGLASGLSPAISRP